MLALYSTGESTSVISSNLYDLFGVKRYEQGSAQTPWRWKGKKQMEEGLQLARSRVALPERDLITSCAMLPLSPSKDPGYWQCVYQCVRQMWKNRGLPEVDWACIAAAVCCAADPEPVTKSICCGIPTACLWVRATEMACIVSFCLLKCLVDRKPIPPVAIKAIPCVQEQEVVQQ